MKVKLVFFFNAKNSVYTEKESKKRINMVILIEIIIKSKEMQFISEIYAPQVHSRLKFILVQFLLSLSYKVNYFDFAL